MSYVQEIRALIGQRPFILAGATVIVRDAAGRILMQQRSDNGVWALVGGAMEMGETLEETARREVWEETGVRIDQVRLLTLLSGPEFFHTYPNGDQVYNVSAVFTAEVDGAEPRPDGVESLQAAFIPPDQLPEPKDDPVYLALYPHLHS